MESRKTTTALALIWLACVAVFLGLFVIYPRVKAAQPRCKLYGSMTGELRESSFYQDLSSGDSVCFLGDSITAGSFADGIPWYESLTPYIKGDISNLSYYGWKVNDLIENKNDIPNANIYVIAIGINDVLDPNGNGSCVTSDDYIKMIGKLSGIIQSKSPNAKIYFIAPWPYVADDIEARRLQFCTALEEWCSSSGFIYIDPSKTILSVMDEEGAAKFTSDGLHPGVPDGIGLYGYAVLKSAHDMSAGN